MRVDRSSGWRATSAWVLIAATMISILAGSAAQGETLAHCYASAQKKASDSLSQHQQNCHNGLINNNHGLTGSALKAEYQLCLHNAKQVYNTDIATYRQVCEQQIPSTTKKATAAAATGGRSTTLFCDAARRYVALPLTLPDHPDAAWLRQVTEPLFTMAKNSPKDLEHDIAIVAVASYKLRFDGVSAIAAIQEEDMTTFGQEMGYAVPADITEGVASAQYDTSFAKMTAGVNRVCAFDMQGAIAKIQAAAAAEAAASGATG